VATLHWLLRRVGKLCRAIIPLKQIAQTYQAVLPEFCKNLPDSGPNLVLMQKLWQNSSYQQLGRMNNCFYGVMTVFAQQFNYCNLAMLGNSDLWLRGFHPFVAIANP